MIPRNPDNVDFLVACVWVAIGIVLVAGAVLMVLAQVPA